MQFLKMGDAIMAEYLNEKLDSTYDLVKYNRKLELCSYYLYEIKNGCMTEPLFNEAYNFSMNTYRELYVENPIIVGLNTCVVARNVTPIEELKLNLEALKKMLLELITKETEDIVK